MNTRKNDVRVSRAQAGDGRRWTTFCAASLCLDASRIPPYAPLLKGLGVGLGVAHSANRSSLSSVFGLLFSVGAFNDA